MTYIDVRPNHGTIRELKEDERNSLPTDRVSTLPEPIHVDVSLTGKLSSYRELGCAKLFVLYQMIECLSNSKAYCWASDKYLAEQFGCAENTIQLYLLKLEKAGYIYRNVWNHRCGRERHIITQQNFYRYWGVVLSQDKVPLEAKLRYLRDLNLSLEPPSDPPPNDELKKLPTTTETCVGSTPTVSGVATALPPTGEELHSLTTYGNQPTYVGKLASKSAPSPLEAGADLKKELERHFGPEQVKEGIEYYELNKAAIDLKESPVGYVIACVRKGWAQSKLREKEHEQRKVTGREEVKVDTLAAPGLRNIPLAKEMAQHLKLIAERWKEKLTGGGISVKLDSEGMTWDASNRPGQEYTRYDSREFFRLLFDLSKNMKEPEALKLLEGIPNPARFK